MRSRSSDPAYWRQKAADFRRRALGNPDDNRLVLLRRALEFDGVADELEELMHGDAPAMAPPRVGVPPVRSMGRTRLARTRLAMAGAGVAFAIGCLIGVAGPRVPIGGATPPVAFDVPAEPAATAPMPPQIVAERSPAPSADERPPASPPPARAAEPSAEAAAQPIESPEPTPGEKESAPPAVPSAADPTPVADPTPAAGATDVAALESPPLPVPDETAAPPADEKSTAAEARHPPSPPPAAASARPSSRSRPHHKAEPLDLRRELPPPEPSAAREPSLAESRPTPTPTRVAVRTWAGYAAPTAEEAEAASQECRPYTASRSAVGLNRPVRGLACRRADGRWQLVTEIPDN